MHPGRFDPELVELDLGEVEFPAELDVVAGRASSASRDPEREASAHPSEEVRQLPEYWAS